MGKGHRVEKAIKDYRQFTKRTGRGGLYAADLNDIYDMSFGKDGSISLIDMIGNALEAGFMIGYKCAKREARKRAASNAKD